MQKLPPLYYGNWRSSDRNGPYCVDIFAMLPMLY